MAQYYITFSLVASLLIDDNHPPDGVSN